MKLVKKALLGLAIAASFALPAQSASVTAGGVTWDPNYLDGSLSDFLVNMNFSQWFTTGNTSPTGTGIGATSYSSAAGINSVLGSLAAPAGATGYYLQGVGEILTVNGNSGLTMLAPGTELTWAFGGIGLNTAPSASQFDITNAWIRFYVNSSTVGNNYTHAANSDAEVALAYGGTLFLELQVDSLALTSGTVDNGLISANVTAIGGAIMPFVSDPTMFYSASAFFNTALNAKQANGVGGELINGNTEVPEPGSLALLGLGLVGLAAARRRKAA